MSVCSVSNCKLQSDTKFHSPRNPQQLNLWKNILNIEEDKFFVCDAHFEEKYVKTKKFSITSDAYPTLFLGNVDKNVTEICQCCLKSPVNKFNEFHKISENFQRIFKELMECELPSGMICETCQKHINNFNKFRINIKKIQKIREEHSSNFENATKLKIESDGEKNEIEIIEFEPEKISISDNSSNFEISQNSSVINFIDQTEIKQEKSDHENIQELEAKKATIQTYSRKQKLTNEKINKNLTEIKEEPTDKEIFHFHFPTTSFLEGIKTEPIDDNDFSLLSSQNFTNKRSLVFDSSEIFSATKTRKTAHGSSSYTSKLSNQTTIEPEISFIPNLKCQYCPDRFTSRAEILVHIQENHNFGCPSCPAIFQYKITLIQHQMSEHAGQASEQTGRMPVAYRHSCPVCKLKFSSAQSLSTHVRQKHKMEIEDFGIIEKPKEKPSKSQKSASKTKSAISRSALIPVKKEVDTETLTKVHNNLNELPCVDCGLLYKPNKLERHRMEKHNKH